MERTNTSATSAGLINFQTNYWITDRTPKSRCKRDAEKKVLLTSAPAHLNITLLRFKYDRENNRRAKVFTGVEYPHTLLLPVGDEQVSYSLFSVVVHR